MYRLEPDFTDNLNDSKIHLTQDINQGVASTHHSFIKPLWSTVFWDGATSFELVIDQKCSLSNEYKDITFGSKPHVDCRYLIPINDDKERRITEIYFSETYYEDCTDNINENRPMQTNFSLHLCWKTWQGLY